VLPQAGEVHKPHVNGFDVSLATHRQDFLWSHRHHRPFQNQKKEIEGSIRPSTKGWRRCFRESASAGRTECRLDPARFATANRRNAVPRAKHFIVLPSMQKTASHSRKFLLR
jgi:hypothetical protein